MRRKPLLPVRMVRQVGPGQARCRPGCIAVLLPLRVLPAEGGKGNDPGVEPRVADLRHPTQLGPAITPDRDLVDPGTVQLLQLLEPTRRALAKLVARADDDQLPA